METKSELLSVSLEKTRKRLLGHLTENGESNDTEFLSNILKLNYKTCAHHLRILERHALVEAKFVIKNRTAVKYYFITKKGREIYAQLD